MIERFRRTEDRPLVMPASGDDGQLEARRQRVQDVVEAGRDAAQRAMARHGTRLLDRITQTGGQ